MGRHFEEVSSFHDANGVAKNLYNPCLLRKPYVDFIQNFLGGLILIEN